MLNPPKKQIDQEILEPKRWMVSVRKRDSGESSVAQSRWWGGGVKGWKNGLEEGLQKPEGWELSRC